MIPAEHALRAGLALKLWSIERKSHVMALVADEGLALFCRAQRDPQEELPLGVLLAAATTPRPPSSWPPGTVRRRRRSSFPGTRSISISTPCPTTARPRRSSATTSRRAAAASRACSPFSAQDAEGQAFCYSNADLRKGEEAEEIFRFIAFWKKHHGDQPRHLVFDSRLTTYANLARLDDLGITFITLRRRSPTLLAERSPLCRASAWRTVNSTCPTRKYKTPRVYEQVVRLARGTPSASSSSWTSATSEPTILLTNDRRTTPPEAASPATPSACSSRTPCPMPCASSTWTRCPRPSASRSTSTWRCLVIASGLYRLLARRMRGYADAQARHIFRDLIDIPADITVSGREVLVQLPSPRPPAHHHRLRSPRLPPSRSRGGTASSLRMTA